LIGFFGLILTTAKQAMSLKFKGLSIFWRAKHHERLGRFVYRGGSASWHGGVVRQIFCYGVDKLKGN
jgi:hypothetical protein